MSWDVIIHPAFATEFDSLDESLQDSIAIAFRAIRLHGPTLGRPWADTLKGSAYTNMKELRVSSRLGEWRIAFAFDPKRQAIVLCGGSKSGIVQRLFYRRLTRDADFRFREHLAALDNMG